MYNTGIALGNILYSAYSDHHKSQTSQYISHTVIITIIILHTMSYDGVTLFHGVRYEPRTLYVERNEHIIKL